MPGLTRTAYTEESAEVEVLLANMDKLKLLTRKIQGSLQRLETSGQSVQDAIKPIHGNTSRLQVTNRNIDRINTAIDKIKQPMDWRKREEPIIRPGLQRTNLDDYMASMDRTYQALGEVEQSNLRSNQQAVDKLKELLKYGSQELESAFREALRVESTPVEPLSYVMKKIPFPAISSEHISKLRTINSFVASQSSLNMNFKTTAIYSDARGPYLKTTLQNLATASVTTAKKTDPNAIYQPGTSGFPTYCDAVEGLLWAEHDNVRAIFAPEQWPAVDNAVCQGALNDFSRTLRELHAHIRANRLADCILTYEVVDKVSNLVTHLESRNPDLKQPIQDALRLIRETAVTSLLGLLKDTEARVDAVQTLHQDGSPLSVTSDTVTRLQAMTAYLPTVCSLLSALGEGGWKSPNPNISSTTIPTLKSVDASHRALFSAYLGDTLDALFSTLEVRSRTLLKSKSAQGVFLSNNLAIIDRAIHTSSDFSSLLSDHTRANLDAWRKKGLNLYLDGWREPCIHLYDVQFTNRTSAGGASSGGSRTSNPVGSSADSAAILKSMNSKERDAMKEKWQKFNASFDELVAKHKFFRIEREVRPVLAKEVQSMIEPLYARFWDRYHEVDKGKGKYVKFDKQGLSKILATLG